MRDSIKALTLPLQKADTHLKSAKEGPAAGAAPALIKRLAGGSGIYGAQRPCFQICSLSLMKRNVTATLWL